VLNFGVPGYGTDQAYLKFLKKSKSVFTPITMLCIWPENINRIVNVWRNFYVPDDAIGLSKPRFVNEGANIKLLPNPIQHIQELNRLQDPDFISKIGRNDYWYNENYGNFVPSFPFLYSIFATKSDVFRRISHNVSQKCGFKTGIYQDLYENDSARGILENIIRQFAADAEIRTTVPIVVILAHADDIRFSRSAHDVRHAKIVRFLETHSIRFIDTVKALSRLNPSDSELNRWFSNHATSDGNKQIANVIANWLTENTATLPEVLLTKDAN
jgi:hypothetical protein